MGGEWRKSTWGKEISLEYGKGLRGYADAKGPVRVFGTNGPVGWTTKPLAPGPGIIVGRKGAYRGVHYSPNPFFVIDTAYYVVPKHDLDMRWLYYAIIYHKLGEINDGSPIPSTTRAAVYVRELQVPPLEQQRTIAEILGSLDDKIELNRRMNRALESIAQAIFKAWFIDFEPVKAKAAGATRFLGMPQEVFDNLPDTLTETELGQVPYGWKVVALSDMVKLIGGGTPKRKVPEYWGGNTPWFSVRDAPDEHEVWVVDTEEHITEMGLKNSSAKVMRAGTTIISARGTVGKLGLCAVPMAMNQSCYGIQGVDKIGDFFVYFTINHAVVQLQQHTHGSVFDTITRKTFDTLQRIRPQTELVNAFENAVAPFLSLIRKNHFETRILAIIRDSLLPKLISGEIKVAGGKEEMHSG